MTKVISIIKKKEINDEFERLDSSSCSYHYMHLHWKILSNIWHQLRLSKVSS